MWTWRCGIPPSSFGSRCSEAAGWAADRRTQAQPRGLHGDSSRVPWQHQGPWEQGRTTWRLRSPAVLDLSRAQRLRWYRANQAIESLSLCTGGHQECRSRLWIRKRRFSRRFLDERKEVPVSFVRRVLLPTEGNPIIPTLASPALETSKPSPATLFLPPAG